MVSIIKIASSRLNNRALYGLNVISHGFKPGVRNGQEKGRRKRILLVTIIW
jgi:hypothetical protein